MTTPEQSVRERINRIITEETQYLLGLGYDFSPLSGRLLALLDQISAERETAELRGMIRAYKPMVIALADHIKYSPDPDIADLHAQAEGNMQRHEQSLAALRQPTGEGR